MVLFMMWSNSRETRAVNFENQVITEMNQKGASIPMRTWYHGTPIIDASVPGGN